MAVKSSEIYFDICVFPINALTAHPASYHLIAALPSNFAKLLLISSHNYQVLVTGEAFFKIEKESQ